MPNVTLPDGTVKTFDQSLTVADVASSIGSGLAKAAIAGEIDGQLVDTSYMIESDASLAIITNKDDKAPGSYSSFYCTLYWRKLLNNSIPKRK